MVIFLVAGLGLVGYLQETLSSVLVALQNLAAIIGHYAGMRADSGSGAATREKGGV